MPWEQLSKFTAFKHNKIQFCSRTYSIVYVDTDQFKCSKTFASEPNNSFQSFLNVHDAILVAKNCRATSKDMP